MVNSENRTLRFNYQMFLKDFAALSSVLAAVNISASGYQVFNIYQNSILREDLLKKINTTSIFFILIGAALSSFILVTSVWAIDLDPKPHRERKNLNTYCLLTCILTTIQLMVHTFDSLLIAFKPYTFYTSLLTALISYVIVLRYYVISHDVTKNQSGNDVSFPSSRYIYLSRSCLYPDVEELLDLVRSSREDNIPTYEELILQDQNKKEEEEEEGPPPPKYEDIV